MSFSIFKILLSRKNKRCQIKICRSLKILQPAHPIGVVVNSTEINETFIGTIGTLGKHVLVTTRKALRADQVGTGEPGVIPAPRGELKVSEKHLSGDVGRQLNVRFWNENSEKLMSHLHRPWWGDERQ